MSMIGGIIVRRSSTIKEGIQEDQASRKSSKVSNVENVKDLDTSRWNSETMSRTSLGTNIPLYLMMKSQQEEKVNNFVTITIHGYINNFHVNPTISITQLQNNSDRPVSPIVDDVEIEDNIDDIDDDEELTNK
ncbi:hypothetical protein LIER_19708 [Lithospermum erythrorhizon]|uniref:Uncharacterized protein n=1 Tax=Lithospermum erythrorhizon TaxID=34254 RepID=A0AAV3QLF1_LITER